MLSKQAQWTTAIILTVIGLSLSYLIFNSIYFPYSLLLIPIIKPIGHFAIAPLLRLVGWLHYYSPMFIVIKSNRTLEMHNGTAFDYLLNMRWRQKGVPAKKKIMLYYLNGLMQIIKEIESKKLPHEINVIGVSYFFNQKTATKIGFTIERVGIVRRLLFFVDYVNLFFMYSYSRGRLTFPNVLKVKKVKISGEKLLNSKDIINRLIQLIQNKGFAAEGI